MPASPLHSGDPRQLGRYRLVGRLGEGGMGSVYLAEDPTGRPVAVKVIRPDLATVAEFRARFRSEVKRARQVPSYCTAGVLDADVEHATPYLVVEYVDGASLAEVIADSGPLAAGNLHGLAIGMAIALAAIHDAGVVHRDLKPSNVLLSAGTTKVIDFGIARALDASGEHTAAGHVVGTLAYMAPERFPGHPADPDGRPADIFAWAAVVLYAATGRTPSLAESPLSTTHDPPDLDVLPHPLRDLVADALQTHPAGRPTAHELLDRLLDAAASGNTPIRDGLRQQPQLRRAAAAVQHTVRHHARPDLPTTTAAADTAPSEDSLPLSRPARRRRHRLVTPRGAAAAAALAVLGLVVGVGAYTYHDMTVDSSGAVGAGSQVGDARESVSAERAGRGAGRNGCRLDGPLVVTATNPTPFRCPGLTEAPPSRSISLRFQLGAPDACAAIWLHLADTTAYRLAICADRVSVSIERDAYTHIMAYAEIVPSLSPGPHQIDAHIHASTLTVALDGVPTLTKPGLPTNTTRSAVTLGLATTGTRPASGAILTIADVEVTSTD